MKILFLILLFPGIAYTQGTPYVQETATSSGTVFSLALSSQPAMDVSASVLNGALKGSYAFEIYNHAASTSTVNCSYDTDVSTTELSASFSNGINPFYGREIPAGIGVVYHILYPVVKVWCMSQSVKGPTAVTITQLRAGP